MKILVADDSKTTLALITDSLEQMGHTVIGVNSGIKAIESFHENRPDLIILDVIMEGMDGFECAKRLRNIDKEDWIPIIFLSGAVDDENIAKGIDAGGDDYLTKPFSNLTLAAKIKAMQRIADMRQQLFKTTKKLRVLSATDRLTGLYNRLEFEKTIKDKTIDAIQNHYSIALLFMDLDRFKAINDTLGHHIGDLLLKEVSERLTKCLRSKDFIARLGGDEFAIILDDIQDFKIVSEIAQKIIHVIDEPYKLDGNYVHIGASIGIAYYPSKNINLDSLIINADIAMYHAKEQGRNNFQFFTDELNEEYNKQVDLKNELKSALEKNELFITYQPVFNLKSHKITRIEALINWMHPKLGAIPAAVFIPLAEELSLMEALEKWILIKTCEQSIIWYKSGHHYFKLSINISPKELLQNGFPELIEKTIKKHSIPPNIIEFELTETSVLSYSEISEEMINKIHNIGVGIVLDDFGTGYSSLTHLKNLPINAVKIDKIFISDALHDVHSKMIIKTIIEFGKNLKFDVIVEGIELKEQLDLLTELDCTLGQGYYLSYPLDTNDMTKLLEKDMVKEEK